MSRCLGGGSSGHFSRGECIRERHCEKHKSTQEGIYHERKEQDRLWVFLHPTVYTENVLFVLGFLLLWCNTMTQNILGEERVYFIFLFKSSIQGSLRGTQVEQEPEQRNWCRSHDEPCHLTPSGSTWCTGVELPAHGRKHLHRGCTTQSELSPPISISGEENVVLQACPQTSHVGHFFWAKISSSQNYSCCIKLNQS